MQASKNGGEECPICYGSGDLHSMADGRVSRCESCKGTGFIDAVEEKKSGSNGGANYPE